MASPGPTHVTSHQRGWCWGLWESDSRHPYCFLTGKVNTLEGCLTPWSCWSPWWSLADPIWTHPVFSYLGKVAQWGFFFLKTQCRLWLLNAGCCRPGPPPRPQCPAASLSSAPAPFTTDAVLTETLAEWWQISCGVRRQDNPESVFSKGVQRASACTHYQVKHWWL